MNKSRGNLNIKNQKAFVTKVAIVFVAALILLNFNNILVFLGNLLGMLMPFFLGIALAYIWNLILNLIEKYLFPNSDNKWINKLRRPVSIIMSILIIVGIIVGVTYIIIPQLYESTRIIIDAVPTLAEKSKNWFLQVTEGLDWTENLRNNIQNMNVNWQAIGSKFMGLFSSSIGGVLGSTLGLLGSVFGFFITILTAIIFATYLITGKEDVARQGKKITTAYWSKSFNNKFYHVMDVLDDTFTNFIKGQCLSALSLFILVTVSMLIFRIPYAFTVGVVSMITAFIPILGAFLGAAIGFLMLAVVNFNQALIFLIIFLVCQQIQGNLIYPKIVGDSIGLPGIWTFVAVILGGSLFGTMGMILAVPIFATFYKLFKERTDKILEIKEQKNERKKFNKDQGITLKKDQKKMLKQQLKQEKIIKQKLQKKKTIENN